MFSLYVGAHCPQCGIVIRAAHCTSPKAAKDFVAHCASEHLQVSTDVRDSFSLGQCYCDHGESQALSNLFP